MQKFVKIISELQDGVWSVTIFVVGLFTKSLIEKLILWNPTNQKEIKLAENLDSIDEKLNQMIKIENWRWCQ